MMAIALAVLLFGLIHPLSKVILDSGIPLSYFCVLYVGIRLIFQLPALFFQHFRIIDLQKILPLLLLFGLCGAGLQYFEFKGISEGLNPGVVTFLMFSYPIWIILSGALLRNKSFNKISAAKVLAGFIGIYLISRAEIFHLATNDPTPLIYPLLASVFIASWIALSNKLRKLNVNSLGLSVFYDLFTFVMLAIVLSPSLASDWNSFTAWSSNTSHLFHIMGYSLFVGLLPNLLFYFGSRTVSTLTAGLAMALEPALSTLYSSIIWNIDLGSTFVVGAALILIANLQITKVFSKIKKELGAFVRRLPERRQ